MVRSWFLTSEFPAHVCACSGNSSYLVINKKGWCLQDVEISICNFLQNEQWAAAYLNVAQQDQRLSFIRSPPDTPQLIWFLWLTNSHKTPKVKQEHSFRVLEVKMFHPLKQLIHISNIFLYRCYPHVWEVLCFYVIMQQERLFKESSLYMSDFFSWIFSDPFLPVCRHIPHSAPNCSPTLSSISVFHCTLCFVFILCLPKLHKVSCCCYTDPQHVIQLRLRAAALCALTFLLAELHINLPINHSRMSNGEQYVNFHNICKDIGRCAVVWVKCLSSMLPCGSCCSMEQRKKGCCVTSSLMHTGPVK